MNVWAGRESNPLRQSQRVYSPPQLSNSGARPGTDSIRCLLCERSRQVCVDSLVNGFEVSPFHYCALIEPPFRVIQATKRCRANNRRNSRARLGSNQRIHPNAYRRIGLLWVRVAGETAQARLVDDPVSSARSDRTVGHQKDTAA